MERGYAVEISSARMRIRMLSAAVGNEWGWGIEMKSVISRFIKNEAGATAIEYALIGAVISIALIATVGNIGTATVGLFSYVVDTVKAAIGS